LDTKRTKRILSFVPAVSLRTLRNAGSSRADTLESFTRGSIISFIVTPCLSRIAAGLSICDKEDNKGSTVPACSFRVAFATFLRTGDISLANKPTSGRISSSNNFTDLFKSRIWSLGNL
jgi:hypothetical protein